MEFERAQALGVDGRAHEGASMQHATPQVSSRCPKGSKFRFLGVDLVEFERNGVVSFSELRES